jgi:ribonuclease HI
VKSILDADIPVSQPLLAGQRLSSALWIAIGRLVLIGTLVVFGCSWASAQTATPVNVPTWRYDNTHSGSSTQETLLTPDNVNGNTFGKLFSMAVDGYVYAQPLYVSGLTMPDGLVHNVLFVATQHDSVYAFDADSNGGANAFPLWQASMLSTAYGAAPGATTIPSANIGDTDAVPEWGIASTPVIDLATQTMYLVAATLENGSYIQRMHAINIITGAETAYGPSVPITATVSGGGTGSSGGSLTFSSEWQLNRVALDLFNGYVYVGFGSHADNGPWHGWLMAFSEQTLAQTGYICLSPNGYGNGIWGAGAGLPIDTSVNPNGRLFLSAANGSFTSYPPLSGNVDYGDSLVVLDLTGGGLAPSDAFTPFNQAVLAAGDIDQGSGGVLMLPNQPGAFPHELVQVGKEGRILVLNRDDMGGYAPGGTSNTNALQDIYGQIAGLWSTPAYWNGHVFFWGSGDTLKRFDLANGLLTTTTTGASSVFSYFPGATPVISSNGTTNGVLWAIRTDAYNSNGSEILYAFDPNNLVTPLYESDTNAARDDGGPATKFVVPVITNGKVYTGAAYQVNVYGLLAGLVQAAAPVISPNGGSLSTAQQVALSTTTPNATIYYTTDGSMPTAASTVYSSAAPITITSDTTVQAIASAQNYLQSPVSSAVFTFSSQTPAPTFTPAAGIYTSPQLVTIADPLTGTTIYYTTDGSTPTTQSAMYNAPIPVTNTTTLNAIGVYGALTPSTMVTGSYVIQVGGTGINFGDGFAEVNGLTLNGSAINSDDSRLQLTNGGSHQAGSVFGNTPLNITSFVNNFAFQLSDAQADGFTFTIQNVGPTALGPAGGGLGYGSDAPGGTPGIPNSIAIKFDLYNNAGEGMDSTGLYENGASPTVPAIDLTPSGINLHSGDSMSVHMTYDGSTLTMTITDQLANATFTQAWPIDIAQVIGSDSAYVGFTGGTGGLSASQKILTWTFVSEAPPVTPTPVIAPNGGAYTSPQSVTIRDGNASATIYYTLDGSTPTTSSAVYNNTPLSIGTGVTTLSAIAVGVAETQSALASATFAITHPAAAAPVFSLGSGTYIGTQTVTLSDTTAGASIYYTTDGSVPSINSNQYSGGITVSGAETINAIAVGSSFSASPLATAVYAIQAPGQTIDYLTGFPSAAGLALNGSAQIDPTVNGLEITDGNGNEAGSAWATTPVNNVSAFTTQFTFQMINPNADGFTFAIQSVGPRALGPSGGALGYGAFDGVGIPNSVALKFDIFNNAGEGMDSIGVYTDGAAPTVPATDLTGTGIVLRSGDPFQVNLVYNGAVLTVTITDTNTSAMYTGSFPVDIAAALGTTSGYIGFTGGTGGLTVKTEIYSWLLNAASQSVTAEPTFSLAPGTYSTPLSVSLNDLTANSTIYYTVDGSQPSHSSSTYSSPIQVSGGSLTIKAFASAAGLADSPVVIGSYNVTLPPVAAAPVFSLGSGTYIGTQTVTLSDTTAGASIYYTTDGSVPSINSNQYSGGITVSGAETINAIAVGSGFSASPLATAAYAIQAPGQTIDYHTGFPSAAGLALNGSAQIDPTVNGLEITDGNGNEAGSAWATTPVNNVSAFTTQFTFQMINPNADGFTFAIQSVGPRALGPSGGALGYGAFDGVGIPNSVALKFDIFNNAGEGMDSIGVYTDGAAPTVPATDLTGTGIVLRSGDRFQVNLVYNRAILTVTITDTNTSATYTGSFPVDIAAALGTTSGYAGFTGGTGGLTVKTEIYSWLLTAATPSVAAAPVFSLGSGTYIGTQTVTLSDTTAGASIYYTTDGSVPSINSNQYSGGITVSGAETINAIAVGSSFSASPLATAVYAIQAPGQTIDYLTGFPSAAGLALNGSAQIDPTVNGLEITDGNGNEAGSAWATTPVNNVSAFTTQFTFQMINPNADGFTFAIQSVGPRALGPSGGALGYGAFDGVGIPNSVALKFDIFNNAGEGMDSIGVLHRWSCPDRPGD